MNLRRRPISISGPTETGEPDRKSAPTRDGRSPAAFKVLSRCHPNREGRGGEALTEQSKTRARATDRRMRSKTAWSRGHGTRLRRPIGRQNGSPPTRWTHPSLLLWARTVSVCRTDRGRLSVNPEQSAGRRGWPAGRHRGRRTELEGSNLQESGRSDSRLEAQRTLDGRP